MDDDMVLLPEESTSIAAAGYDAGRQVLRLRYTGGGTYDYLAVPPAVFAAFRAAESKGRFVNFVIKPRFPYRRVDAPSLLRREVRRPPRDRQGDGGDAPEPDSV